MTRPRPALVVLLVSLLALVASGVVLARTGTSPAVADIGQRPTSAILDATDRVGGERAGGERAGGERAGSGRGGEESGAEGVTAPIRLDARGLPAPSTTAVPTTIVLPRPDTATDTATDTVADGGIDVDVVGLDAAGLVEVPADIRRVGWYRFSAPIDADRGSTVLVGHRDGAGQGLGAFAGLGDLRPGDAIVVRTDTGARLRYEVVARESFAKDSVPLEELFSRGGPKRLTLITCGGPFDAGELGYTDNIVVTAIPLRTGASDTLGPRVDSRAEIRQTRSRGAGR